MELGKYRLGYLSRMKNVTNPPVAGVKPKVGPYFLERATQISESNFRRRSWKLPEKQDLREVDVFVEAFAKLIQKGAWKSRDGHFLSLHASKS